MPNRDSQVLQNKFRDFRFYTLAYFCYLIHCDELQKMGLFLSAQTWGHPQSNDFLFKEKSQLTYLMFHLSLWVICNFLSLWTKTEPSRKYWEMALCTVSWSRHKETSTSTSKVSKHSHLLMFMVEHPKSTGWKKTSFPKEFTIPQLYKDWRPVFSTSHHGAQCLRTSFGVN